MNIDNKKLEEYLIEYSNKEDKLLYDLNRQTHLKVLMPRMLSGELQGVFLEMLSRMIQAENILEIGTYTGYSAICLAKGLKNNGKLYTIEINDEIIDLSSKYFHKAGFENQIIQYVGDAVNIIPKLNRQFDLVFIDGDKRQYPKYYDLIIDKLKPNGYIIADNVLWDGKVIDNPKTNDSYTKGIIEFNKKVKNDKRVDKLMLPFRDGLYLIRKKD